MIRFFFAKMPLLGIYMAVKAAHTYAYIHTYIYIYICIYIIPRSQPIIVNFGVLARVVYIDTCTFREATTHLRTRMEVQHSIN